MITPTLNHWENLFASKASPVADVEIWLIHPCPHETSVSDLVRERFSQNDNLTISKDINGKPSFDPSVEIVFSGAHCRDAALLAVGKKRALGVDIEKKDVRRFKENIIKVYFTEKEKVFLDTLPLEEKVEQFFHMWVCKEAVVKATGLGPQLHLEHIQISNEAPRRVAIFDTQTQRFEASHLVLYELSLPKDYIGYVASGPMGHI